MRALRGPLALLAYSLLICLLVLTVACDKSKDKPGTTDTPDGTGVWADTVLATLNEQPITINAVFATPEVRRQLLDLRTQDIEMRLIRYKFNKEGLTLDEGAYTTYIENMYTKMGVAPQEGKSIQQVFEESFLAEKEIDPATWKEFTEAQYMAEELVKKLKPVTDAEVQAEYDSMPASMWFQQFGQQFGWAAEVDVNPDSIKPMINEKLTRDRVGELTTSWGQEARAASTLTVNRLPSEPLPPETTPAEGEPTPDPEQAPAYVDGWKVEAVAYVLDGEERTWEQLLASGFVAKDVERFLWTPVEQAILDEAWTASGLTLTDDEFATERTEILAQMTDPQNPADPATQLKDRLIQIATSEGELDGSIRRYSMTKRLLAKEFPVTDAEVDAAWASAGPEQKGMIAQQLNLAPEAMASLTLDQARPILREMLESERGGVNREEWVKNQLKKRIDDGTLVLVDPRLKLPEEEAPMEMPMGGPGGPGGAGSPGGAPEGGTAPITIEVPAPEGEPAPPPE